MKALHSAGQRAAVPQVEADLTRGRARLVSRHDEIVPDLRVSGLRLVATHQVWAQENTVTVVAQVVAQKQPTAGGMGKCKKSQ